MGGDPLILLVRPIGDSLVEGVWELRSCALRHLDEFGLVALKDEMVASTEEWEVVVLQSLHEQGGGICVRRAEGRNADQI